VTAEAAGDAGRFRDREESVEDERREDGFRDGGFTVRPRLLMPPRYNRSAPTPFPIG
jgi:hypothetical protein